jgi:hypothetical protein
MLKQRISQRTKQSLYHVQNGQFNSTSEQRKVKSKNLTYND